MSEAPQLPALERILPSNTMYVDGFGPLRSVVLVETFMLGQNYRAYAIANPGTVLSLKTQTNIMNALKHMSKQAFQEADPSDLEKYWNRRRRDGYFARLAELFLIADGNNQVVGFSGYSVLTGPGYINFYVDTGGIIPGHDRKQLTEKLIDTALVNGIFGRNSFSKRKLFASTSTQTPIVYKFARKLVDPLYPTLDGMKKIGSIEWRCARDLVRWYGGVVTRHSPGSKKWFDMNTLIEFGGYDIPFFRRGRRPASKDPAIDALFDRLGDRDGYVLIGPVRKPGKQKKKSQEPEVQSDRIE